MSNTTSGLGEMDRARVEAVTAMSESLIKTIVKELEAHGKDPHNSDIIAAAMALTIHKLAYIDPAINFYIATIMASGVKPGDFA